MPERLPQRLGDLEIGCEILMLWARGVSESACVVVFERMRCLWATAISFQKVRVPACVSASARSATSLFWCVLHELDACVSDTVTRCATSISHQRRTHPSNVAGALLIFIAGAFCLLRAAKPCAHWWHGSGHTKLYQLSILGDQAGRAWCTPARGGRRQLLSLPVRTPNHSWTFFLQADKALTHANIPKLRAPWLMTSEAPAGRRGSSWRWLIAPGPWSKASHRRLPPARARRTTGLLSGYIAQQAAQHFYSEVLLEALPGVNSRIAALQPSQYISWNALRVHGT